MAKQPAKPRKPRANTKPKPQAKVTKPEPVIDAKVVSETPAPKSDATSTSTSSIPKSGAKAVVPAKQPNPITEKSVEKPAAVAPTKPDVKTPTQSKPTAPPQEPERKGTVLPLVFGGIVAGAVGYGVAYYQFGANQVTAQDLAQLRSEIPDVPAATDLSGLTAQIDAVSQTTTQMDGQMADVVARLTTLESQPNADGTLPQAAIDAFESDMQALRDQVATQQAELQSVADQASAQLETTRDEALRIEQSAVEAARDATAKASLARVQGALESGAPFGGILGELEAALGEAAPAELSAVSDGTATLGSLQSEFPLAARGALASARSDGVDGEETSGFSAFLRNQLDVRSVAPKEGASVDAVLSRAEAALRDGRLNDTLAEIAALPDVARAAMSDWLAQAEARAAAIDAADALSNSLSAN